MLDRNVFELDLAHSLLAICTVYANIVAISAFAEQDFHHLVSKLELGLELFSYRVFPLANRSRARQSGELHAVATSG